MNDGLGGIPKDTRKVLLEMIGVGFTVTRTRNGHLRITHPSGIHEVTPTTPRNPGRQAVRMRQLLRKASRG